MIDTDKYEGHLMNEGFQVWAWSRKMLKVATYEEQMATAALLRDTPLLFAEVKRLREQLDAILDAILWDAFSEEDTTLEIDREVAERIGKVGEEE